MPFWKRKQKKKFDAPYEPIQTEYEPYQTEYFRFEYPNHMRFATQEKLFVGFCAPQNPLGVLRIWHNGLEESELSPEEILKERREHAEDYSIVEVQDLNGGEIRGLRWRRRVLMNPLVDGLYWPNEGVNPLFDEEMPQDPIQLALTASNLSYMVSHRWDLIHPKVEIAIRYRTYYVQPKENIEKIELELQQLEDSIRKLQIG